jgi:hypothetical protein
MKVKALLKVLQVSNPEATVLLSHDGKGSGFDVLSGYAIGNMVEGSPGPLDYTDCDDEQASGCNCLVLYPD